MRNLKTAKSNSTIHEETGLEKSSEQLRAVELFGGKSGPQTPGF